MPKLIGILRVRDESDLLPSVLDDVSDSLDEIFAYDDGSVDRTLEILQGHEKVTYIKTHDPSFTVEVDKTRHLENEVKSRYPMYTSEEVWVALLAGDLYWLNTTPRDTADRASASGFDLVSGVAINFSRWNWDGVDTWPNWHQDIRLLCQRCNVIEILPVVWKVTDYTEWGRLPWPRFFRNRDTEVTLQSPFLEHQGKRSPRYHRWKYSEGGRGSPRGTTRSDWDSYDFAYRDGKKRGYWENPLQIPWEGLHTINKLLELEQVDPKDRFQLCAKYKGKNFEGRNDV